MRLAQFVEKIDNQYIVRFPLAKVIPKDVCKALIDMAYRRGSQHESPGVKLFIQGKALEPYAQILKTEEGWDALLKSLTYETMVPLENEVKKDKEKPMNEIKVYVKGGLRFIETPTNLSIGAKYTEIAQLGNLIHLGPHFGPLAGLYVRIG